MKLKNVLQIWKKRNYHWSRSSRDNQDDVPKIGHWLFAKEEKRKETNLHITLCIKFKFQKIVVRRLKTNVYNFAKLIRVDNRRVVARCIALFHIQRVHYLLFPMVVAQSSNRLPRSTACQLQIDILVSFCIIKITISIRFYSQK